MCGIAGAFRFDGPVASEPVERMVEVLHHRGPDSHRTVSLADGVLGASRLAIVDVEGGINPLSDSREQCWISLNGEVYNHRPLRTELKARGARFATGTDTEVTAWLTSESLESGLHRLHGMFAMALYDVEKRRLVLVRDRLGQKPLYYTQLDDGTLLFASELKGLLVHPQVKREVDPTSLEELLLWEYIPAPRSIYRGIHKLEAGCLLEADATGIRHRRWWHPPLPGSELERLGRTDLANSLFASFQVAVKERMTAEVPVAYLLSGGIDSTAVSALAASRQSDPLHTFSVVFEEDSFDESGPASIAARHIGSVHQEVPFPHTELARLVNALEQDLCEPLADNSYLGMYLLSEAVREAGFPVALSGDGADEHFGGYPTYLAHKVATPASRGRGLLKRVAKRLPVSTDNLSHGYKARRFTEGLGLPLHRRNQVWLGAFLPRDLPALLGRDIDPWSTVDRWGEACASVSSPVQQAMYMDQRLYLGEGVLAKVDRASMAHSLEVRSPFLHHELVALAARMPASAHISGTRTKCVLRQAFRDLLPAELLQRPKKGFGTPLGPWLAGPCSEMLNEIEERLEGVVAPEQVQELRRAHLQGDADNRRRLWTLLVLGRWWHGPWGPRC